MPISLTFDECGDGIGDAWTVLRDNAARAGLDAPVPTCPGWSVRDLVAHQGMVHRWTVGVLAGTVGEDGTEELVSEGLASGDLLAWFDDGARDLLAALAFAPEDLDAWFFLRDAPTPRLAWARRQCHETTIHAVDAMSAALGRQPRAAETWLRPGLATDGIDELLLGFLPRKTLTGALAAPLTLLVRTTDTKAAWTVSVDDGHVTARVGTGGHRSAEGTAGRVVEVSGSAAQVYLGLWNRGDELTSTDPDVLHAWVGATPIHW